jgi:hypothetical protein
LLFHRCNQIGVDASIRTYYSNKIYGSWWCGLTVIIVSIIAFCQNSIGGFCSVLVVSIIGIVVCFIGASIDSNSSVYLNEYVTACLSATGRYNGHKNYYQNLTLCPTKYTESYDCYCIDRELACTVYEGKTDCTVIMDEYATLMTVAAWFDVLVFLSVVTISILTCCAMCCPNNLRSSRVLIISEPVPTIARNSINILNHNSEKGPTIVYGVPYTQSVPHNTHITQSVPITITSNPSTRSDRSSGYAQSGYETIPVTQVHSIVPASSNQSHNYAQATGVYV